MTQFSTAKPLVDSLATLFAISIEESQPPTEVSYLFLSHINFTTADVKRKNVAVSQILSSLEYF